tara:strand:+ start:341 stop:571 length:231 start_codon:yes stop_codon:yes gene_type:complete
MAKETQEQILWATARDMLDYRIAAITGGLRLTDMGDNVAISEAVSEIADAIDIRTDSELLSVMKQFDLTWLENISE